MELKLNENINIYGKSYIFTGTYKKSLVFERGSKKYKMSRKKVQELTGRTYCGKSTEIPEKSELAMMVEFEQIFNKNIKIPTNAEECEYWFKRIENQLSPENLACDGELSNTRIRIKLCQLKKAWKELEKIANTKRTPVY